LEADFDVQIVTQNVDDLHERAGSSNVLHLHGELRKVRSTKYEELVYNWEGDLNEGDVCEKGAQLRPHIVWFGELVPAFDEAKYLVVEADVFVVIGTSLQVYPAAGLVDYAKKSIPKFIIDPKIPELEDGFFNIQEGASVGVKKLSEFLKIILQKNL
jgi:NAD-dependent deacetylase